MPRARLTSKGQITIPKAIRRRLGLRKGERFEFRVGESGEIVMERGAASEQREIVGLLRHLAPDRPVSLEEMARAVADRARAKEQRRRRR